MKSLHTGAEVSTPRGKAKFLLAAQPGPGVVVVVWGGGGGGGATLGGVALLWSSHPNGHLDRTPEKPENSWFGKKKKKKKKIIFFVVRFSFF